MLNSNNSLNKNTNQNNSAQNASTLPKMRTVKEAAFELRSLDPHTAITEYHIRQLAVQGVLTRVKAGKKMLINLDELLEYLGNPSDRKFVQRKIDATPNRTKIKKPIPRSLDSYEH